MKIILSGDISFEYCESEKKARFIASRLCIDHDIIVVYDQDLNKLFIKSISSSTCGFPEGHKHRLSLVANRSLDCTDDIGKQVFIYLSFVIITHYRHP